MTTELPRAVGAPLDAPVRPCVWIVSRHDAPAYWIPFLHEPVDALQDPEREVVRLHWPEELAAERENYTALLHAYHQACVDAANRANEIERLRGALLVAVRQNEHDMLMTGEELRACRAALAGPGPNVRGNRETTHDQD
jgi:hypothetical protein